MFVRHSDTTREHKEKTVSKTNAQHTFLEPTTLLHHGWPRGSSTQNKLRIDNKASQELHGTDAVMKNQQVLQNLKLYLEYLRQDPTCNPKVLQHVERRIREIQQS